MTWDGNINSPHTIQDEWALARELGVEKLTTDDDGQMIPVPAPLTGHGITNRRCPECGRLFDLTDPDDAAELVYGHDCEAQA